MTTPAVRVHQFSDPETIAIDDIAVPAPQAGEASVYVFAASVNPVDWKTAEGQFEPVGEAQLPLTLGRDLAGEILDVGPGMEAWEHGARVCAFLAQDRGAQAGTVILNESELVRIPDLVPTEDAGAVPLAGLTAWQGLFDHGGLQPGQRVLIHGAAGGVGHLAVQFARLHGCHIFATASARDLDFVRSLGADVAIDYATERFEDVARDLDLVFDTQGGETQARSFATLRRGGMLVSTLDPDEAMAAEHGVRTVPRWHAKPDQATLARILDLLDQEKVKVEIARRFKLDEAVAAHRYARTQHPRGKVILVH